MKLLHYEKNFQYTDQQFLSVARKIGKLGRYCKTLKDASSSIRVEVESRSTQKKRDEIKVSITIELPHKEFHADSRKADVIEAVDRCTEKLQIQLIKYKEKQNDARKKRAAKKAA